MLPALSRRRRLHPLQRSARGVDVRWSFMAPRSLALTTLVLVAVSSLAASASAANTARAGDAGAAKSLESSVLVEINALRRAHGRSPLRVSASLSAAANGHSRSMGARGFFEHESVDGTPFWRRVERHYGRRGFSYWAVGENLLWAAPSIDAGEAVNWWLESPPHRANLLDRRWREVGLSAIRVAAAPGAFGGMDVTILTANFGVRR